MLTELSLFFAPLLTNLSDFWGLLFLLIFGHFMADFVLQSQAMSKAKNSTTNPKEIWIPIMIGHCMIHAGIVYLITWKLWLAIYELVVHFIIDDLKCKGMLTDSKYAFAKDQVLHILDMVIIAVLFYVI